MSELCDVVVIGGGQAGLVASHALTEAGVDHVVLERARLAERWRSERWDWLRFLSLREAGITTVIWSTGYSFDDDWVHAPGLDGAGQPLQHRGVGQLPGLYFLGLHWMHTFKSGTFLGIGDDAAYVVEHLETRPSSRAFSQMVGRCPARQSGERWSASGSLGVGSPGAEGLPVA